MRYIEEVASVQVSSIVRFDSYSCHWEGTSLDILKKGVYIIARYSPLLLFKKQEESRAQPEVGQAGTVGIPTRFQSLGARKYARMNQPQDPPLCQG